MLHVYRLYLYLRQYHNTTNLIVSEKHIMQHVY